jgi:hypothetical protein
MSIRQYLRGILASSKRNSGRRRPAQARPTPLYGRLELEPLEQRTLLSLDFIPAAYTTPIDNTDAAQGLSLNGVPVVEPQIAVNPQNPGQIALSSHGLMKVSNDGGATYGAVLNFPLAGNRGDTSEVFDNTGRLFWTTLTNPASGGGISIYITEVNPQTGKAVGTVNRVTTPPLNAGDDKENLTSDRYGDLYVSWTRFFNCTDPANLGGCTGGTAIMLARSTDHGATWAPAVTLSAAADGYVWPSTVTVAANDTVFVAYHSQPNQNDHTADRVVVVGYNNDLGFQVSRSVALPNARIRGSYPNSGFNTLTIGIGQAWVLADPRHFGNLYVVGVDDPSNGGTGDVSDVLIARSTDFGVTWSQATVESGPTNTYRVFVTAAIDQFGDIAIAWYDNRALATNSAGNYLLDVYAAYSTDGGQTWSSSFKISDRALDTLNTRIDEYFGIAVYGDKAYVAWEGNTFDQFGNRLNGQQCWTDSFGIRGALRYTDTIGFRDNLKLRNLAGKGSSFELLQGASRLYVGQWSNMTSITLNTGFGPDTVDIENTVRGVPVTVDCGTGNGTTIVSGDAGVLRNIAGDLIVNGDANYNSQLVVNDAADAGSGSTITVTANTIQQAKLARVGGFATGVIRYQGFRNGSVTVNGGPGGNTFNIQSTSNSPTMLVGSGPDNVNIGVKGSVQYLGSPLTITNPHSYSAVNIDDSADSTGRTVIIYNNGPANGSFTVISGLTRPGSGDIKLQGADLSALSISTGDGGNAYRIHDTPAGLTTTINTGAGSDVVTVDGTTGALNLNLQLGSNSVFVGTSNADLGRIQGAVNITGSGIDHLKIDDSASLVGHYYDLYADHLVRQDRVTEQPDAALISFRGMLAVALYGGHGPTNTLYVLGSSAAVDVYGAPGSQDTFAPLPGFQPFLGPVACHGQAADGDFAYYDDTVFTGTAQTYTVSVNPAFPTIQRVDRTGEATVTYDGVYQVLLNTAVVGGNAVNVQGVAPGIALGLLVFSGDQVTIGSRTPNLGGTLANIHSLVLISGAGATGPNVTVDDSADTTGRVVTISPPIPNDPFNYSEMAGLAPSPIFWHFNSSSGHMNVLGGLGDDSFAVQGGIPDAGLSIDGGSGVNTLTFDDSAATSPHNYQLSVGQFIRDDGFGASLPPLIYNSFSTISLNAADGGSTITVNSTAAGTNLVINSGMGPDLGVIGLVAEQNALLGPIALHIQPGAFELVEYADLNNPNPQTYTFTNNTIGRSGQADVTYDGAFVGAFAIELFEPTVGGNKTYVQSAAAGSELRTFDSNGDQVVVGSQAPNTGGDLHGIQGFVGVTASDPNAQVSFVIDDSGNMDTTPRQVVFSPVRDADGYINMLGFAPGSTPLGWNLPPSSSVKVLGGTADTIFSMQPIVAQTPLTIVGGTGSNTLDYSGYITDPAQPGVTVNLQTGIATGLAGISDPNTGRVTIQNVIGSIGNDVLTAGADRSILIGGGGADQLFGGSGEDLLIAGATDYTQPGNLNLAALDAIIQEWNRTDLGFDDRMSDLFTGSNPTGTPAKNVIAGTPLLLNNMTVHDDLAADSLTGGTGRDWFIIGAHDQINNGKPGDAITMV